MSEKRELPQPTIAEMKADLKRERYKNRYRRMLRSTIGTLLVVAAVAVLAATLWFPILKIFGNSMTPTLRAGQIVVAMKGRSFETGDILGFYYGNKLLVKRYIAGPGDWINITEDGVVFVNNEELDEPYLTEKAFGDCNIELPYQVPDGRCFVMGDHRSTSIDSRNMTVGSIAQEQIVGKILFRVWPLSDFGVLDWEANS